MDSRLVPQWQSISARTSSEDSDFISLADIATFLKQYARTIAACVLAAVLCAWFYVATTDRVYTAQTQILIEPKMSQLLQQQQTEVNLTLDTAQIESQIAVMQSEKIATMVINELNLAEDPIFNRSHSPTFTERLLKLSERLGSWDGGWLGEFLGSDKVNDGASDGSELSHFERSRVTMWAYRDGLDVRRVGVSYAINISFQSLDPETSAKVANATAEAFVREQLETKAASARQGGAWLELRLNELRAQMNLATKVEQQFRAKHDYSVGGGQVAGEGEHGRTGAAAPTLEELQVTADTYRKMYESFLQAYTNSVSQQSYPVADARVITAATRPLSASAPRPKLLLAFGMLAGLMVGVALAFVRHTLNRTLRSSRQLREEFGLECLGELPPLSRIGHYALNEAANSPYSKYSNSLRSVKTAVSLASSSASLRCIGVVSALPSDGKSSFASNLAALYSMCGDRTLLIDADICGSVLSNGLLSTLYVTAPVRPESGGEAAIVQRIVPAANAKFDILPSSVVDAGNLLASKSMRVLLPELQAYDMIIVDLPSLTGGSDRLVASSLFDGVILVAEWGRTPLDLFGELVRSLHASKASIIGALMTNVRARSTKAYNGRGRGKAR